MDEYLTRERRVQALPFAGDNAADIQAELCGGSAQLVDLKERVVLVIELPYHAGGDLVYEPTTMEVGEYLVRREDGTMFVMEERSFVRAYEQEL